MLPFHTSLDPEGYYAILGLDPAATPQAVTAAFRRKARVVHPDVPGTGDASAFVALRKAYEVLSNRQRRERYDQAARRSAAAPPVRAEADAGEPATDPEQPDWLYPDPVSDRAEETAEALWRRVRFSGLPIAVWAGLAAFLLLCVIEAALNIHSASPVVSAGIKPNAAAVTPLSPTAERTELYGPNPERLAGTPNFYVIPLGGAAVLWRKDATHDGYQPLRQLPPFSTVQAVRLYRQSGLMEILSSETTTGFIDAKRLAPGDADAARRAYCEYNAGPPPYDGELLGRQGQGNGSIQVENRAIQPLVMKLRDPSGAVALAVFLGPGSHADLAGVPDGPFRAEFAIGEFWSRACNTFAAGMRARVLADTITGTRGIQLVVPPDDQAAAADISDLDFEKE